jgi:hypothetical protein
VIYDLFFVVSVFVYVLIIAFKEKLQ